MEKNELYYDILEWEEIRRSGRMNMFGMGAIIGKERAIAVIKAYEDGTAKKIIDKEMPE